MPQMYPMNWILISIFLILIIMLIYSFIFSMFNKIIYNPQMKKMKNIFSLKLLW